MIINGEGHVLGRLASLISKKLLEGEEVVVVNAEKIMITGSKDWAYAKYKQRVDRASISNPRDMGPKYPRRPEDIFRRTVRGMLPYKKSKGRVAFKGLKAYVGVPKDLSEEETSNLPQAQYKNLKKGIALGEVSKLLGAKF
ncbi:50S ribosomal protein L13 [Methanobrevibacter filiformis]|uniref:Large ribosomal subunit protein uL13 n=1 Tax=Methanobrevibacter filiformis TaxID=55758 RepID=A0A162FL14_9EURY|nr:50S ribosomal protein L13 [Methanobrevibacter filiformis]KZX11590.1 50S ribosomal protein L13 [Methanobrevibacter filiformis]